MKKMDLNVDAGEVVTIESTDSIKMTKEVKSEDDKLNVRQKIKRSSSGNKICNKIWSPLYRIIY